MDYLVLFLHLFSHLPSVCFIDLLINSLFFGFVFASSIISCDQQSFLPSYMLDQFVQYPSLPLCV